MGTRSFLTVDVAASRTGPSEALEHGGLTQARATVAALEKVHRYKDALRREA